MAVNRGNLGFAQGVLQGVERNRLIGLEDADRERRQKREDIHDQRQQKHDARADEEHGMNRKLFDRKWQAMQRAQQAEGAEEFVRGLKAGVNPNQLIERFNSRGISKIKPETFQYDPETGAVTYEEVDGDRYEGSLEEMEKLVEVFKGPKPPGDDFTLSPGQTRFNDKGEPVANVPAEAGGNSKLPADAQMVEYLVGNKIVGDKGEAYALVRQSRANPAEAAMKYVQLAMKAQEASNLMPGVPGYKTMEQLQDEAMQWIQKVNEDQAKQFRTGGRAGGLEDAGNGLPGNLGRHAEALGRPGPTRARAATGGESGTRRGAGQSNSPYPEGTRLVGPDGERYVVRNGQPVPEHRE